MNFLFVHKLMSQIDTDLCPGKALNCIIVRMQLELALMVCFISFLCFLNSLGPNEGFGLWYYHCKSNGECTSKKFSGKPKNVVSIAGFVKLQGIPKVVCIRFSNSYSGKIEFPRILQLNMKRNTTLALTSMYLRTAVLTCGPNEVTAYENYGPNIFHAEPTIYKSLFAQLSSTCQKILGKLMKYYIKVIFVKA